MAYYQYSIADGHSNTGGLINIENLTAGGKRFYPPAGVGSLDPGIREYRGTGLTTFNGFASLSWVSNMTFAQYSLIIDTYCDLANSEQTFSGLVTIRSRSYTSSYANYNATLIMPTPNEIQRNFTLYMAVRWTFIQVEAL